MAFDELPAMRLKFLEQRPEVVDLGEEFLLFLWCVAEILDVLAGFQRHLNELEDAGDDAQWFRHKRRGQVAWRGSCGTASKMLCDTEMFLKNLSMLEVVNVQSTIVNIAIPIGCPFNSALVHASTKRVFSSLFFLFLAGVYNAMGLFPSAAEFLAFFTHWRGLPSEDHVSEEKLR
ncbi:hypothetical protein C8R44DRAFT_750980 [Mycena epipterygia]|nr:hypothetical protein C8R44DRAFT_750980 [Mycena epipterygia]